METDSLTIQHEESGNGLLDLDRFADTPLTGEPFEFLVVPGFVPRAVAEAAALSFAAPDLPGVLPAPRRTGHRFRSPAAHLAATRVDAGVRPEIRPDAQHRHDDDHVARPNPPVRRRHSH